MNCAHFTPTVTASARYNGLYVSALPWLGSVTTQPVLSSVPGTNIQQVVAEATQSAIEYQTSPHPL